MTIFQISPSTPLQCPFSLEKYTGGNPNPELTAMAFSDCNFGLERLELMDRILSSEWYVFHQGRFKMGEIKVEFGVTNALFNAALGSEKLLSSDGLFNLDGLHGGERRTIQKHVSYSNNCPMCHNRVRGLYQSRYLNRQLKFGRIDLSRWEIVQMKLEEVADFAAPLVEAFRELKQFVSREGRNRLSSLSKFLHSVDFYVNKFEKKLQTSLVLSLGIKVMCLGYEKIGIKMFKKMHQRINSQVNVLLIFGSMLFVWKGLLYVVDQDPAETVIIGTVIFLIYLLGFEGLVKLVGVLTFGNLMNQAMEARAGLNRARRER
ncbi:hypothetical protein [Candidatus Neptunichlamydia sp. REUL1]|uniref:hypothetical protein n=1 Tax=Candidatus Neptunichlamydia sp. REUL1 TaxID=3064277 RepID=UPI00292E0057|nr:hypothetical protein [Candidatus Neptunochlamydia sp. REUL1]